MGQVYGWIVWGEMPIQATDGGLGYGRPVTTLGETERYGGCVYDVQTRDRRHVMVECCVLGGARTKLIETVGRIDLVDI